MNRAVFLDRDGTLNEEREYLRSPEQVSIFPGVAQALIRLRQAGFRLIVITNQSGVGRGYYTMADVEAVHQRIVCDLAKDGAQLDKFYIAPEAPSQSSRGRKPSPALLFDARDEFGLDLAASYIIGDKLLDLECGWNAGLKRSILVRTGYGAIVEKKEAIKDALVVDSLSEAADWILNHL